MTVKRSSIPLEATAPFTVGFNAINFLPCSIVCTIDESCSCPDRFPTEQM